MKSRQTLTLLYMQLSFSIIKFTKSFYIGYESVRQRNVESHYPRKVKFQQSGGNLMHVLARLNIHDAEKIDASLKNAIDEVSVSAQYKAEAEEPTSVQDSCFGICPN